MIDVETVTKRYGDKVAVDELSFSVRPGIVTGFLRPNGSGKSTTMRLILGLDSPDSGRALVNGKLYRDHVCPLHEVGALLEARSVHTGRTAANHLLALAQTHGIGRARVDELIDMVGLREVAGKRGRLLAGHGAASGHRLGPARRPADGDARRAGQRARSRGHPLGARSAQAPRRRGAHRAGLLAPDERDGPHRRPPDRDRSWPADRRHRGQRLQGSSKHSVRVRSPQLDELCVAIAGPAVTVAPLEASAASITGIDAEQLGRIAAEHRIVLYELTPQRASLEEAFMELTRDEVEYHGTSGAPPAEPGRPCDERRDAVARRAAGHPGPGGAFGILACVIFESRWPNLSQEERHRFHPLRANLAGVNFAQLAFGALGVLSITAEYSTGMIRSTFSAVPKRLLWGKLLVFAGVAFAVSLPAVLITFFAGEAILAGQHIDISLSHSGVLRSLIGAALYMTVMGLFGLGLGAALRSTAGGISALAGIVFVLPPILGLLPASFTDSVDKFLPSNAGGAVWTITPDANTLAPWAGFAVFCAWAAVAIAIAAVLMVRRDT